MEKRAKITPMSEPHVIHPNAVYTAEQVRRLLGLRESSLRTAKREQGLRCCRRAGHDYYLGEDLLTWLKGGRCSRSISEMVERTATVLMSDTVEAKEATDG